MRIHRYTLLVALIAGLLPAMLSAQNTQMPDENSSSANNGPNQVLVDPGVIYNNKHSDTWVGKTVTLKNVMVQDTNKSGDFWVGSDSHGLPQKRITYFNISTGGSFYGDSHCYQIPSTSHRRISHRADRARQLPGVLDQI